MSTNIITIENDYLEYRDTPWDERAFGFETKEILDIRYSNYKNVNFLIEAFENKFTQNGLAYFRTSSNNNAIKKDLIQNGYYIAEASLKLNFPKFRKKVFSSKRKLNLIEKQLDEEEIEEVKNIAKTSFDYSRFHEDPFISKELSSLRYENWINDLVKEDKKVLLFKNSNGEILSFMFYSSENSKVNLILGGSKKEYGYLTPSFFSSVMLFLQNKDIKSIEVIISMSNKVIFNIYSNLGFNIKETMFDYHKFITRR